MSETHLVTGATGFVGSALVLELLRTTDVRVVCLVRPSDDEVAAQKRLQEVLENGTRIFDCGEIAGEIGRRCRAIAGDLSLDRCGVTLQQAGPVREVWHSAASLRYEEEHKEEIFAQNVDGTQRALALCHALGAPKFNYISTAYVAGLRSGMIREELPDPDQPVKNFYEASKVQAELLVARSGLDYRILRPSIVIGHSKTSAIINPSGIYGVARQIAHLRKILDRNGELHRAPEVELEGDARLPLNVIPVDAVVSSAVRISRSRHPARVFHLTNSQPPTVGILVEQINSLLGIGGPRLAPAPDPGSLHRDYFGHRTKFYVSYFRFLQEFDRTNTDAVLGSEASRWPVENEGMRRYLAWYFENALGTAVKRSPA